MKKYIPIIAITLIFIIGVGVLSYPLVSSVINNYNMRQNAEVQVEEAAKKPKPEIKELFKQAAEYNASLINTVILTDPFDEEAYEKIGAHYQETFDVDGKGLIGYVDIPKINVYLPIYTALSPLTPLFRRKRFLITSPICRRATNFTSTCLTVCSNMRLTKSRLSCLMTSAIFMS